MAGISTVEMAAAVTNNGGLGSIPFGSVDLREGLGEVKRQLEEFSSLTGSATVNLNFFCHDYKRQSVPSDSQMRHWYELFREADPRVEENVKELKNANVSLKEIEDLHPDILEQLLLLLTQFKPKVVSFHFGFPSCKTIGLLQLHGIMVFAAVTSVEEAKMLSELNIDGLICQGYEAGGHRGNFLVSELLDENLSTSSLFQQVKAALFGELIPFLIPAGGITSGTLADYYLRNGASAVVLGTAFLAAKESNSNDFVAEEVTRTTQLQTIVTSLISGKPARCLRTPFIENIIKKHHCQKLLDQPSYGYAYFGYKKFKSTVKDESCGFYLAGQNYHQIQYNATTAEILQSIIKDISL